MAVSIVETVKAGTDLFARRDAVLARLAGATVDAITPEEELVLRWHGLYRHQPEADGVFLLRVKLPQGTVTAAQLRVLADVARRAGYPHLNLTTRQDLQVYGLRLADLPGVFAKFDAVGLTAQGACGDVVRNVTGCPVAGLDPRATCDTLPLAREITAAFLGNAAFANLPRKFKIAVSGCADGCVPVRINDLALVAAHNAADVLGYALFIGGGLSVAPALAQPLDAWVAPEAVIEVTTRLVELFQAHGDREHRGRARLKHVIATRGLAWVRAELEARLGWTLTPLPAPAVGGHGDHLGVHPQHAPDRVYIGVPVPAGRLRPAQVAALAELGEDFRVTHQQNLVLAHIPRARLAETLEGLAALGLPVRADGWAGRIVACPGSALCLKALAPTKELADTLLAELADLEPAGLRLQISGCPNGCGQHAIADIGLQGARTQGEARFDLWTGGGDGDVFARRTLARLHPDAVGDAVRQLAQRYRAERQNGESFSAYARRRLWPEATA